MLLGFVGEFDGKIMSCNIQNSKSIEKELEYALSTIVQYAYLLSKKVSACELIQQKGMDLLKDKGFDIQKAVDFMNSLPKGLGHERVRTAMGKNTELYSKSGIVLSPRLVCMAVFLLEASTVLMKSERDYNLSLVSDWFSTNRYTLRVLQVALNAVCINMGKSETNMIRLLLGELNMASVMQSVGFEFNDACEMISWTMGDYDPVEEYYADYYNKFLTVGLLKESYCNIFYQLFFAMLDSGDRALRSLEKTAIASAAGIYEKGDFSLLEVFKRKGLEGILSKGFTEKFVNILENMLEDALDETRGWEYVKEVQFPDVLDAEIYGSIARRVITDLSEDDMSFFGMF